MEKKNNKIQQVGIKICCIIASFMLWLYILNIENPVRTYKLKNVPVSFINTDSLTKSNMTIVPEENYNITLTIKGRVTDIYSVTPEDFVLIADFKKYALKKGENKIPVKIKENKKNVTVIDSDNLWVKINIDELMKKVVPIKLNIKGKEKKGFYFLDPILENNNAEIKGPIKYVQSVTKVIGECNMEDLSSDFNDNINLKAIDLYGAEVNNVTINPNRINVKIPVKRTKFVKINIKTKGELNNKSLFVVPDKVRIIGDNKIVEKIDSLDTELIDLDRLKDNSKLKINLIVPKGVDLIDNNKSVELKINSDKISNKTLTLNISEKNLKDNYKAILSNKQVGVTVSGLEEVINNLKNEEIQCYVDLNSLIEGEHNVPINVILPEGISKESLDPESIKVTIEKDISEDEDVNKNK